tara:strand:- start:1341 stop:1805 length:465 start_codon:yes stop_codon:yes gene_type:complete
MSDLITKPKSVETGIYYENDWLTPPQYATEHSAGADLRAVVKGSKTIKPGESSLISCGFSMAIPDGYFGLLASRSGLASKGIALANGIGVIDSDYRGEVMVCLRNYSDESFDINSGMRIAQIILMPYDRFNFVETSCLSSTKRDKGGFGSTGVE